MNIKKIGVAGAGAMGAGIAQVFAQAGFEVVLYDLSSDQLKRAEQETAKNLEGAVSRGKMTADEKTACLKRISYSSNSKDLVADLIVEAIVEKLEIKQQLFTELAAQNNAKTILASNTSSIPITRIAKGVTDAGRVIGLHFFNPAHIMKLVEIIVAAETRPEVVETIKELTLKIGKTPVVCKDSPGFIVNRVARHYYVESLKLLEENVAPIETIDALMESAGFKLGPFKLMDMVGNDINFAVTSSLFNSFHQDAKFRPSRIQQQKVDAGHLGKKTGRGFYNYE